MKIVLSSLLLACCVTVHGETAAQRIVTLAPNLTELVFAAGAGDRIVGADLYSDYPAAAKSIPRVGDAFRVDTERVLALRPDLVLTWGSGTPQTVIEGLQALGLNVVRIEVSHLAQVSAALRQIGLLTGRQSTAENVAQSFEKDIETLRGQYAGRRRLSVFIEVDRQPLFTVNGQHVISEISALCGGDNVFGNLNQLAPAIGVEAVIAADPEVILASSGGLAGLQAEWSHWPQLKAVRNRRLYAVNPDLVNRATPRIVDGAREICAALDDARRR